MYLLPQFTQQILVYSFHLVHIYLVPVPDTAIEMSIKQNPYLCGVQILL